MKFVADVMLGTLSRLMRFGGYDVEYDNRASDATLRKRSIYRILLTKDRELSNQIKHGRVYFVRSSGGQNQFKEIQQRFPIESSAPRCIECNSKLRKIKKRKVEHLVPPYVYRKYPEFYHCRICRRVYWTGTHFEGLTRMLK